MVGVYLAYCPRGGEYWLLVLFIIYQFLTTFPRLARLTVDMVSGTVVVRTSNVGCFSIDVALLYVRQLDINGCIITIPDMPGSRLCFQNDSGNWRVSSMPLVGFTATTMMAL
jgi:hypothetical protein